MKVIIVGAGKLGEMLIRELKFTRHEVAVMDYNEQKCTEISQEHDVLVFKGDVTNMDDLNEVKVRDYDLFISTTGGDEKNILGCLIAKDLGVKRVIARVSDPRLSRIAEKLGITHTICPEIAAAEKILAIVKESQNGFVKKFQLGPEKGR